MKISRHIVVLPVFALIAIAATSCKPVSSETTDLAANNSVSVENKQQPFGEIVIPKVQRISIPTDQLDLSVKPDLKAEDSNISL